MTGDLAKEGGKDTVGHYQELHQEVREALSQSLWQLMRDTYPSSGSATRVDRDTVVDTLVDQTLANLSELRDTADFSYAYYDPFLTLSEINRWRGTTPVNATEPYALEVFHEYREELEELSDDELGDENDGITPSDISALRRAARASSDAREIEKLGLHHFDRIDLNEDGFLSADELLDAPFELNRPAIPMYNRISEIEEASNDEFGDENDGITRRDLRAYRQAVLASEDTRLVGTIREFLRELASGTFDAHDLDRDGLLCADEALGNRLE